MDCTHDIFISYPSTLNRTPYADWVTKFEARLRHAFEDLSTQRPAPDIYLDQWKVEANSSHSDMLERARRSRLFLAIVSPNYQERVWAPRELEAFANELRDWGRLFVIASKPLPENEVRLEVLKGRPIKAFYNCPSGDKLKAMPFHPESREFEDGVYALATAMATKLDQLLCTSESAAAAPLPGAGRRTVLLAQPTDDLENEFRSVATELEQHCREHGITVMTGGDRPQGGEAFKKTFVDDLARADLVVQLLSDTLGKRPRDLPEGYVVTQARAASSTPGVKLMQWRRSNIDAHAVEDPALRDLLQGETVMASTLSAFKDALIQWVKTPPQVAQAPDKAGGVQVFINAEKADWPAALACSKALSELCAAVWFPPEGNPEKESTQKEFKKLLADCDSLLFLNGEVDSTWVAQQLREAIKTRLSKGLQVLGAVCNGPPPENPGIHGIVRGIEILECRTPDGKAWKFEPVQEYVKNRTSVAL